MKNYDNSHLSKHDWNMFNKYGITETYLKYSGNLFIRNLNINKIPYNVSINGDLFLSDNPLSDLSPLESWRGIANFTCLSDNIKVLPHNVSINGNLNLSNTRIQDFTPLESWTGIHDLKLPEKHRIVLPDNLVMNGSLSIKNKNISNLSNITNWIGINEILLYDNVKLLNQSDVNHFINKLKLCKDIDDVF